MLDNQLTFTCSKSTIETLEKKWEICSKLTIKTWRRSGVFVINFEHISHLFSVDFEQANVSWVVITVKG